MNVFHHILVLLYNAAEAPIYAKNPGFHKETGVSSV